MTYHGVQVLELYSADEGENEGLIASFQTSEPTEVGGMNGTVEGYVFITAETKMFTNGHKIPNVMELARWFRQHKGISADVTGDSQHCAEEVRFTSNT